MEPHGMQRSIEEAHSPSRLRRALGFMSIATMVMTIPQVWTIWASHQAAGVSPLSWGAYLVSAALWLVRLYLLAQIIFMPLSRKRFIH